MSRMAYDSMKMKRKARPGERAIQSTAVRTASMALGPGSAGVAEKRIDIAEIASYNRPSESGTSHRLPEVHRERVPRAQ